MTDTSTATTRIEQAREMFFAERRDPDGWIAPHIARSWHRSVRVSGLDVDPAPLALATLHERREHAMLLLECAQPELDGLAEHAVGHGCVVILTDASGLILDEIGSPDFLPKAERVALAPGIEWSEGRRGTNAIGTAIAEREALMVLGGEHYLPQNGALGCAAAPILTGRGEVAGAIDISGETMRVNADALGLVRMAADQIEHRMLLAGAQGQLLRFHHRPGLLGSAREGLLMLDDGHVVAANRSALAMLGASWDRLLGREVASVLGMDWGRLERLRTRLQLPNGLEVASTAERIARPASRRASSLVVARTGQDVQDAVEPLLAQAVRVLDAGVSLLITGETGSGKEVLARRIHRAGRRRAGPFVAVNCAALPETLIEAELFGYEEGAFTGSRRRGTPGRMREANGGVLFLDEIGDMPLALQTRLLRALEERVVTPLGGGRDVKVDFDLVCATHGDLSAMAAAQRFRSDLLYRVAGFTVTVPALRERGDRLALIQRLFDECGSGAQGLRMDAEVLARLDAHPWPGNVRELRSVLQTLVALAEPGTTIGPGQLPLSLRESASAPTAIDGVTPLDALAGSEIARALQAADGNVSEAARRLGVHRSTVHRFLKRRAR